MCGINGVISSQAIDLENNIREMNNLISHRGPDDEGLYVDSDNGIAMGMRRLSIIDLSSGNQPMFSEDKNIVIVFNGEIYNFHEVKSELAEKHGVIFKTHSDTEVILKGYEIHGKNIVNFLKGMFAFSILDKTKNTIFIARDRFGEKPLYYFKNKDVFCWGSELKSVVYTYKKKVGKKLMIDKEALSLYFQLTFIPAPFTIYEGIRKLEAGHWMEIDTQNLTFSIQKYWLDDLPSGNLITNYKDAQKELKDLLYKSVEQCMIADVPLGIFLSGGIDSSIITAIAKDISKQKVQTFSIGFEDKTFDESDRIKMVTKHLNVENHLSMLNPNDLINDIDTILLNYDEPFADSSALPTYWVSKMTSKYVKVALTGDGGDEVFGGYNRYLMTRYANLYNSVVPNSIHKLLKNRIHTFKNSDDRKSFQNKASKFIGAIGENELENLTNIIKLGFQKDELVALLKTNNLELDYFEKIFNQTSKLSWLKKCRFLDKNISLEGDMLVKVDRASMLSSLECRAPFLDYKLWEFSNKLPDDFLIKGKSKKHILKDTFAHLLPKDLFELPKSGFGVPVGNWLKTTLKEELLFLTSSVFLNRQNMFHTSNIQNLVRDHLANKTDYTFKLWTIFCFQKWYVSVFENNHNSLN